ncbi:MAG: hypothetical protein QNL92_13605 [Octadecabacter sp.]
MNWKKDMPAKILIATGLVGLFFCGLFGWFLTAIYSDGPITNGISYLTRDLRQGLWVYPAFFFALWLWGVILKKEASVRGEHARNFGIGVMLFSLAIVLIHSIDMHERKIHALQSYEECLRSRLTFEQAQSQIDGFAITEPEWNYYVGEDCRQKSF